MKHNVSMQPGGLMLHHSTCSCGRGGHLFVLGVDLDGEYGSDDRFFKGLMWGATFGFFLWFLIVLAVWAVFG